MTYRGFMSRAEIGLRPPRSRSTNITPENGGSAGHYGGPAQNITSHADCPRKWRGWQNYHMDTHGWVDIAYTLGVCDHGYILAGRGAGVRTAANGTNAGNQNYYAICWIGGQGETPTQDAKDAFWAAVRMLREQGGAGNDIKKHKDFKATACPGNLGNVIDQGETGTDTGSGSGGGTVTPTPDPEGEEIMKRGDNGDGVKAYQRRINQWATQAGRLSGKTANKSGDVWERWLHWGIDGDFGGTTEDAVKEFQTAYDLPVTGQIGGVTAGILAMFAVNASTGSTAPHNHDGVYAKVSHGHSHNHDARYVSSDAYAAHTHDEGRTGRPQ